MSLMGSLKSYSNDNPKKDLKEEFIEGLEEKLKENIQKQLKEY
jgi:hypothetical protein